MALYGKYRPQNFANLVGQDHIRQTLLHEIQKQTLTHAYLFAGPRGTGKTSTARLIAKALNCEKKSPEGEPCDSCDLCNNISSGNLIDVIEIDAASNRGIDEIRDLKEKIKFAPTRAKSKTYIIDEVHMLTKEAFNALLKTLEEPPENVFFILCTTEIHKIPDTIISRCQRFDFKRIDVKTIMTRLNYIIQMEGIKAEDEAIELIARHVEGSLRDAIGLLEQMKIENKLSASHVRSHLGITGHVTIETLLDLLEKKDLSKAIHIVNEVHNEGYDLNSFVREILEILRERLISGIQHGRADEKLWLEMIERFEEARDMMRNAVIPQLPIEIAVIKICGYEGDVQENSSAISQKTELKETKADKKTETIEDKKLKELATVSKENTAETTKEEKKTAESLKKEFNYEQFKGNLVENWPRVYEQVQPPALRRSLSDAKISQQTEDSITLNFKSKFHLEKVSTAENKSKVEKTIEKLTGKKIKINCELAPDFKDTSLTRAVSQRESIDEEKPKAVKTADKTADIAEKAMEMFGTDD